MSKPKYRGYKEVRRRLGPGFDPTAFDLAAVNRRLAARHKAS